jgi:hypothetical protein
MKPLPNPLESVFNMASEEMDIESQYGMAEVPLVAQVDPAAVPPPDIKDEDDILVEKRIDEVYDAAIGAFNNQTAYLEVIEPRYAARNAEVAANYLNIALAAANSRAKVKTDRKRANQQFVPYANTGKTTNNLVIANREDVLKMISMDTGTKELK